MLKPAEIIACFKVAFPKSRPYGNQIIIIEQDPTNKNMRNNIAKYLEYRDEVPLLAFNYEKEIEEGFVISDCRIAWYYGTEECSCELIDIGEVELGRSMLARTMNITDVTGKKYPKIYLTGIDNEEAFVEAFRKFLWLMNNYEEVANEAPPQKPSYSERRAAAPTPPQRVSPARSTAASSSCDVGGIIDELRKNWSDIDGVYYNGQNSKADEKVRTMMKNLSVPGSVGDVFAVYDETLFGAADEGCVITTDGVYVRGMNDDNGHLVRWSDVSDVYIDKGILNNTIRFGQTEMYATQMSNDKKRQMFCDMVKFVRDTLRSASAAPTRQDPAAGRFCPQCGAPVQPGGRFCASCGTKLA